MVLFLTSISYIEKMFSCLCIFLIEYVNKYIPYQK